MSSRIINKVEKGLARHGENLPLKAVGVLAVAYGATLGAVEIVSGAPGLGETALAIGSIALGGTLISKKSEEK